MDFSTAMQQLFAGFANTLLLFFITLILALPLGLLISLGSLSKF